MTALAKPLLWLVGGGVLLMMAHVVLASLGRAFLGWSALGTIEIVTYIYMVTIIFAGIFLATLENAHVKVDVIHNLLPAPIARICDVVAKTLTAFFFLLFAYALTLTAIDKTKGNETVDAIVAHIWIWPMRWVAALSIALALLALFVPTIGSSKNHPSEDIE